MVVYCIANIETMSRLSTYTLRGTRMSPKRTNVETGSAEFVVGRDVNPVEYLLGSVAACVNSTGTMVARDMDLDIESLDITVEGSVDYARYHGDVTDTRPGLQALTITVDISADAAQETIEHWLEDVKRRCPITDTIANETPLDLSLADSTSAPHD